MNPSITLLIISVITFVSVQTYELSCPDLPTNCNCTQIKGHKEYDEVACPLDANDDWKFVHHPDTSKAKLECFSKSSGGEYVEVTTPFTDFPIALKNLSVQEYMIENCLLTDVSLGVLGAEVVTALSIGNNEGFKNNVLRGAFFNPVRSKLEVLRIGRSQLVGVDREVFFGMTKLKKLSLANNELEVVDGEFSYLQELIDLDLSYNKIHTLTDNAFTGLTNLKILHLYNNKIKDFGAKLLKPLRNLVSLELTNNLLTTIEAHALDDLPLLQRFSVRLNNITSLPEGLFRENKALERVRIGSNKDLKSLPNGLFGNLRNLTKLDLDYCSLKYLSGDLFENSVELLEIHLENNNLQSLPDNLFRDTVKLTTLNIYNNEIVEVDNSPFQTLKALTTLDLSGNNFTNVSNLMLKGAKNLETLNLRRCKIATISIDAFPKKLTFLDLSHNNLHVVNVAGSSVFQGLENLRSLILNHNFIDEVIQDFTLMHLETLNMSHNNITYIDHTVTQTPSPHKLHIDLRHNLIETVDLSLIEIIAQEPRNTMNSTIFLDNNPLMCDCALYDFLRYVDRTMNPNVESRVTLSTKNLQCLSPKKYSGRKVASIKSVELTCDIGNCAKNCTCLRRPFNNTFILDCAGRGFERIPVMTMPKNFRRTEVRLQDNFLTKFNANDSMFENVSVLNVSNNFIREFTWISNKTEMLHLDNNNISRLSDKVLANFSMPVSLYNNPWICDCKALKLVYYVKNHMIPNKANITCANSNRSVHALLEKDICPSDEILVVAIVLGLAFLITVPSVIFGIYYRFNREIKVWLYAHNMFLWFVTEEDLDKDKVYDAFISYSHVDEGFVVEELVTKLEGGANPFKLCIHVRNFVPGEFITKNVIDCVRDSRRTIVVLSPDFLDSVWGKLEFRTAHTQAMSEGRARVIVILLGNVDIESSLDDELRVYLKTNTYIKWGDPWFWDKLLYALPHQAKLKGSAKKLQNISINLDKMDLINGNLTPNTTSTPPAHPLLLKSHPLDFKPSDGDRVTPPAESGNDVVVTTNKSDTDVIKIRI